MSSTTPTYRLWAASNRKLALVAVLSLWPACSSNPPASSQDQDGGVDTIASCPQCGENQYCCKSTGACENVPHDCQNIDGCGPGEALNYGNGPFVDDVTCQPLAIQCTCDIVDSLAPGIWGKHNSLTATDSELLLSAYEEKFGDLVLVRAPLSSLDAPTIEVVDGVPDAPPTKAPSGYRKGISNAGDDVGQATRLLRDGAGKIWIVYHDLTNRSLKLAREGSDTTWAIQTVASPQGASEVIGRHSAFIMAQGKPVIATLVENIAQTDGTFKSELRLLRAGNGAPTSASDWSTTVIAGGASDCRNVCPDGQLCFVTSTGSACQQSTTDCSSSCGSETACLSGVCQPILIDSDLDEVPALTGMWPRLHYDGQLIVLYHDGLAGTLAGAREDAQGMFMSRAIVTVPGERVGGWVSSVLDDGLLYVAHQNLSRRTLHYSEVNPQTLVSRLDDIVDDGYRLAGAHFVGADIALALDGSKKPQILYQDQTTADLLWASRKADGTWSPLVLTDENLGRLLRGGKRGWGFYNQLVTVTDGLYASSFVFDTSASPFGVLELFAVK